MITGNIKDIKGEALPGVAVRVEGTDFQSMSNARGEYRIPYQPGDIVLTYLKTGYTPGRLELISDTKQFLHASDVSLWPLPLDKGVYLFENFRYKESTKTAPEAFITADHRKIYAARRWPEVDSSTHTPLILCYKMPRHGVQLCELRLTDLQVTLSGGGTEEVQALAPYKPVPAQLIPIDGPDGVLAQLELPGELPSGMYAVHWGILDGRTEVDTRAFMFSIVDFVLMSPPVEEKETEPEARQ